MNNWKMVLALLLGLAAVALIALIGATTALTEPYDPAKMAYWVQAVGSIVAIAGAVWATERQSKVTLDAVVEQHRLAAREKRCSAMAIVEASLARAKLIHETINSPSSYGAIRGNLYRTYDKSIVDGLVTAMNGIPVHELGSSKAVAELLLFRDQFVFLATSIQKFIAGPTRPQDTTKLMMQLLSESIDGQGLRKKTAVTPDSILKGNVVTHLTAIQKHGNAFLLAIRETT